MLGGGDALRSFLERLLGITFLEDTSPVLRLLGERLASLEVLVGISTRPVRLQSQWCDRGCITYVIFGLFIPFSSFY